MSNVPASAGAAAVAAAVAATPKSVPSYVSEESFAPWFDGPVIEPVRLRLPDQAAPGGVRIATEDIAFERADMDYWETWASNLKTKRRQESTAEINRIPISPAARAEMLLTILSRDIQIFEVLDQQFTPAGIKKILGDAMERAGVPADRRKIALKSIPPGRQQTLAREICSEPVPTIMQLRGSLKQLAAKLGQSPGDIMAWSDEELIRFAMEYSPPKMDGDDGGGDATGTAGAAGGDAGEDPGAAHPTSPADSAAAAAEAAGAAQAQSEEAPG